VEEEDEKMWRMYSRWMRMRRSGGGGVVVVVVTVVVVVAVDTFDCLYICIGDGGGPPRSPSIRTRANVAEVTGWRFTFPSWDPPNLSIHWETHRSVSTPFRQRQRTAMLLLFVSNPTRRHRHLHCLYYFKRKHRGTRTKF
jgi:hypothetical protein